MKGKGYPDCATRYLLKMISLQDLNLPIYALMDNDPYGVDILSVYKFGSRSMAFDADNLAVPRIQWLGLRCVDWWSRMSNTSNRILNHNNPICTLSDSTLNCQTYGIYLDHLLPNTYNDRKKALALLSRQCIRSDYNLR